MQTRDFLEQAVFLTSHFELFVATSRPLPERALQDFWVASRSRFDLWGEQLRRGTDQLTESQFRSAPVWWRWSPLLEEVLISEIVTRVWAYLLEALDDRLGVQEYAPIGRSAFRAHLDARRRVLNLILRGRPGGLAAVRQLNRQRITSERWTDLLLGQLRERPWLADYAFDIERVRLCGLNAADGTSPAVILSAASRAAFADAADVSAAQAELHCRMHAAILGCFGPELFRGDGWLLSDWQARLLTLTDDRQGLLSGWLRESAAGDADGPKLSRRF